MKEEMVTIRLETRWETFSRELKQANESIRRLERLLEWNRKKIKELER